MICEVMRNVSCSDSPISCLPLMICGNSFIITRISPQQLLCFYFSPYLYEEQDVNHKKCHSAMQKHNVSITRPVISSGAQTWGRTCSSFLNAEVETMPGGFLSSPVSPPSISYADSSAKVLCIVNKMYPLSEPAACLKPLLGFVCRLGGTE